MNHKIKEQVKSYISKELIRDSLVEIKDDTVLIRSGLLDSIKTLQLIAFLEQEFKVDFEAHEVDADYLDSLILIENTIKSKLS
ncbi:MAG: acyl carrier protein [Roseivirga sp.]|nr:acyl carrier protein [Roseivirga sp.]